MNIPPPGTPLVAYLRDSGGGEQELSIASQRAALLAWAAERGLHLRRFFVDEARSASGTSQRPAFQEMLAYFRTRPAEAGVLVWKLDRFSRNLNEALLYSSELRLLGYQIYSLNDNLLAGPEGAIYETLLHYANEQYSLAISVNVKRGQQDLFRQYGALGGVPPRGFRRSAPLVIGLHRNGKERIVYRWEPDPDLIPLVRRAFELRAINLPYNLIQSEVPLYSSKNCWPTFFANPLYKGEMHFAGQVNPDYCEPIVSPELWQKVQTISNTRTLKSNAREHPQRVHSPFLLSGLVYCWLCGSPLYYSVIAPAGKKERREYYVCQRRNRKRDCPSTNVPRKVLEEAVITELENHALSLEFMLMIQASQKIEHERTAEKLTAEYQLTKQNARSAHRKLENLVEALGSRPNSPALLRTLDALEIETANLDAQLSDLEQQLTAPPIYSQETLSALADKIKAAIQNKNTRRETIRSLIHRVLVRREETELKILVDFYAPQSVYIGQGALGVTHSVSIQVAFKLYQRLKSV